MIITMVNRHYTKKDTKQKKHMAYMESTYLLKKRVTPLDLAIINKPDLFTNSKQERSYKNGVEHAKEDLKLFDFFLINLRPKYRRQIINSNEFQNMIQQVLDIGVGNFYDMTKEEKENVNVFAMQLMTYALKIIVNTTPIEFLKLVKDSAIPLNNLLEAIYSFSKNNNLKELPPFRKMTFPITEAD